MRLYLDTNIFIYASEARSERTEPCRALLTHVRAGRYDGVTSEITLAELLAPSPDDQMASFDRRLYRDLLTEVLPITLVSISRSILYETVSVRQNLSLKLPDAIHVATATNSRCDMLLSADKRLASLEAITVMDPTPSAFADLAEHLNP